MKASQFTDAQKAFIIKQGEDGMAVAEICRKGSGLRGIPRVSEPGALSLPCGQLPSFVSRFSRRSFSASAA